MSRLTRSLVIALSISLIVNFTMIGFVGVRIIKNHTMNSITGLVGKDVQLPKEIEEEFRLHLRSKGVALVRKVRELNQARAEQHRLMVAPILDLKALEAAQQDARVSVDGLVALLQSAFRETISDLPQEVRAGIPENLTGARIFRRFELEANK